MQRPSFRFSLAAFVGCCGVALPVCAQVERTGGGEAQKMMQQYQQLAAEKTSLQTQLAQMKKDFDAAHADLAALKRERDGLKAASGAANAAIVRANGEKQTAEQSLEQSKQRLAELIAKFRDMAQNLKTVEQSRTELLKSLNERSAAYDACAIDNEQLYGLGREVLDRYEHVGLGTKIATIEPFTKIARTRIENLATEYRARADELRIKKAVQ